MKKITLTESDLLKIVNKVLNEQEDRQFDEDEIDILYHIFERELKPPFRKGRKDRDGDYKYYNRDNEYVGWLASDHTALSIKYDPYLLNIEYKVYQVFGFSLKTWDWLDAIRPHLKSWMGDQLNTKIHYLYP